MQDQATERHQATERARNEHERANCCELALTEAVAWKRRARHNQLREKAADRGITSCARQPPTAARNFALAALAPGCSGSYSHENEMAATSMQPRAPRACTRVFRRESPRNSLDKGPRPHASRAERPGARSSQQPARAISRALHSRCAALSLQNQMAATSMWPRAQLREMRGNSCACKPCARNNQLRVPAAIMR